MFSIKEKLEILLISILIALSLSFMVYMIVLHSLGFNLTAEAYAQIISALATILVVVLTLGLRLIDDASDRLEKVVKPKIYSLRNALGETGAENELQYYCLDSLPSEIEDLIKNAAGLKKNGRFFLIKLYPQKLINKAVRISSDIDRFVALQREIVPYWKRSNFESNINDFLMFVIRGDANVLFLADREKATEAVAKLNRERPKLISQIRKLRKKMLSEIVEVIAELDAFLDAN